MNLRRRLQNYIALNNYVEALRSNILPDEYTQLEYITGDGSAYIDLGISLTQDDGFELDFIMPSSSVSMQNIFGYRNSASSNAITAMIASSSNAFVTDFNNSDYSPYRVLTSISTSTEYKVITNKNSRTLYQGDTVVDSNTTACGDTITTGNVLVFNIGGSPAYTNKFTGSIKKVIISDRMYLIPAKRNSDNVIGMFDLVSNKFFTNVNNTGDFIAGPNASKTIYNNKVYLEDSIKDSLSSLNVYGKVVQTNIPDIYEELEYIVFDSTQIIDTGFTPDNDSRIESKCYRTGEDCWFYGASPTNPRITLYHSRTGTSRWGNQSLSSIGFSADTEYTLIEDKNGLSINGVNNPWTSGTAGDFTCDRSLTIGNNNGSTGTRYFAGNLYYMKIYDNNVLVRDFIPVKRKSDNFVGLYDKITKTLFVNNVGNNLIAGPVITPTPTNPVDIYCNNGKLVFGDPDVPSEYKRLLDIIFDGDIYYVTNTYLTGADTTTFTMNATENGRNVLGCYTGSGSGNNLSFYLSTGNTGNYVRYKDSLYRPILANSIFDTDLTLSIGPTGTTGFDTDATWTELEFVSPDAFYIGWLANASSPKFKGSFIGNIAVSNRANFIPCERVFDGAIGYYDTYSNTFFEKQGTGTPTTSGYDYSHYTVIAEGTPEKLNIKGNNLYDITKDITGKFIGENGSIGDEPYSCYSDLIPVKEGESYTYSGMCNVGSASNANNKRIHGYVNGVWNQQVAVISVNKNTPFYTTFTIPAGINGIRISHWTDDSNTQVEECYRPTKYNNYLDMNLDVANLLSIGDYIDSQDILNGSIIRNVGVKVLNGTEEFNPSTLTNCWTLSKNIGQGNFTDRTVYCTHFNHSTTLLPATDRQGYAFIGNSGSSYTVGFGATTLFPTQTQFKQWLADQFAAGTPVIIVYPLKTPTTESVTPQTTLLSSNNNAITRDSEYINDLGLDLTYKKLR